MPETSAPLQKKRRPVGLIVLGILGIILSISGFLSAAYGMVYIPILQAVFGYYDSLLQGTGFDVFSRGSRILGGTYPLVLAASCLRLIVYGFGLAASIGLLKNRPWSRTAGQITAWAFIGLAVVGAVIGFLVVSPMLDSLGQALASLPGSGELAAGGSTFMTVFSILVKIELVAAVPFASIPPIVILVFLGKPHIKEHYRALRDAAV